MILNRKVIKNLSLFDRIVVILAILGVVFITYILFRKSSYITVTIKVGEDSTLYYPARSGVENYAWFAQLFHPGMKEVDGLGRVGAEVMSVFSYDTYNPGTYPVTKAVYLTTKIRAVYNRASQQYNFKGSIVSVGSTIKLNLDNIKVEGLVTGVEGMKDPRNKARLLVKASIQDETSVYPGTSGTTEYIANAFKVGDEFKDGQGNAIIKILEKKVKNARAVTTNLSGEMQEKKNPLRYDVDLVLEVNAVEVGGRYYLFDDNPILIGQFIPLNTPFVSIHPVVTDIRLLN